MQKSIAHVRVLITRLTAVLLIYLVCRLLFYAFNHAYYKDTTVGELLKYLFFGLRFDIPAIIVINAPYIILQLLPFKLRYHNAYQKSLRILFYITNSLGILANCIDLVYFRFTFKRTTADALSFFTMGDDLGNLMPVFIKDYWYIFLIWIALTWALIWMYKRTRMPAPTEGNMWHIKQASVFIVSMAVFLLGYRGGFQLKPVSIISAGEYADARHIPIIVNTPFTIIKTLEQPGIEPRTYFSPAEALSIYSPYHKSSGSFRQMNVVVIIMESFSKEYTSLGGGESYTPFLDSLMREGLVFTNAYANGKRSIEALPAIVAGVPTVMNEPYITSVYGSNRIESIPSLLKQKGYTTAFYHGGINGTMGFDAFATLAGFDRYYGLNEYNNEKDYDGNWGIWDEEFFQYFANNLNTTQQPFCTAFFSLSSHHPFAIPAKYKVKLSTGPLEIHQCVRYADLALGRFFQTASRMPWFQNTLFVITADHTGLPGSTFYNNSIGNYAIPIIFYKGDGSLKGVNNGFMQHIDLMPSIMDLLGYDKSYFCFGSSAFAGAKARYGIQFFNDTYQLMDSSYVLQFDGSKSLSLYNFAQDSLLEHDLLKEQQTKTAEMEKYLKAFIQVYHHSLVGNSMTAQ
jgi:hypothetical protein